MDGAEGTSEEDLPEWDDQLDEKKESGRYAEENETGRLEDGETSCLDDWFE